MSIIIENSKCLTSALVLYLQMGSAREFPGQVLLSVPSAHAWPQHAVIYQFASNAISMIPSLCMHG